MEKKTLIGSGSYGNVYLLESGLCLKEGQVDNDIYAHSKFLNKWSIFPEFHGIVERYDADTGVGSFLMEFIDGMTLSDFMGYIKLNGGVMTDHLKRRTGFTSLNSILVEIESIDSTLNEVFEKDNIWVLDVHSENVMLVNGEVKIIDVGCIEIDSCGWDDALEFLHEEIFLLEGYINKEHLLKLEGEMMSNENCAE